MITSLADELRVLPARNPAVVREDKHHDFVVKKAVESRSPSEPMEQR